jgi:hypothetical protein
MYLDRGGGVQHLLGVPVEDARRRRVGLLGQLADRDVIGLTWLATVHRSIIVTMHNNKPSVHASAFAALVFLPSVGQTTRT